jgi:serine protease SohB
MGSIVAVASRQKGSNSEGELKIDKLNDELTDHKEQLEDAVYSETVLKQLDKDRKKEDKIKAKAEKKAEKKSKSAAEPAGKRVYVIDFDGDIKASDVELMRREITAILTFAEKDDEIVVRTRMV